MIEYVYNSTIIKVISGGQTGADEGGLEAGHLCGLPTGGHAPRGYRTQTGNNPSLLRDKYGLEEHPSDKYPPRTKSNVQNAEYTVILGDHTSTGCKLTSRYCKELKKPYAIVNHFSERELDEVVDNIISIGTDVVLNIAGNRENYENNIYLKTVDFVQRIINGVNNN